MITIEKYQEIENSGLLLDHYFLLQKLYRGEKVPDTKRVRGYLNLLDKLGFIEENRLTEKSISLVETDEVLVVPKIEDKNLKEVPFTKWSLELHKKCQEKLIELTGKKQKVDKIGGTSYSFLCNDRDLNANLYKIFQLYKLKTSDREDVEKCILNHIDKCHRANNWFPTMYYYIFKNNKSALVTDLKNIDEEEESSSTTIETII